MFDLSGHTALITGASGGIGGAAAKALANCGAQVLLSGTSVAKLDNLKEEIGDSASTVPVDLTQPDAIDSIIKNTVDKGATPDIIVLNAGVTRDGLALRMSDDDWDTVIKINLTVNFKLAKAFLRPMMKNRFGRIIAITSVVGAMGNAGQANYAASKAGVTGMIKSLALETAARGITANCIAPGYVDTAMTQALPDKAKEKLWDSIPMGRVGEPDDIAGSVVFLASKESSYITGQTVHVNGGLATLG